MVLGLEFGFNRHCLYADRPREDVKFQVFKNGKVVEKFTLCGAYVFGTDGISVRRTQIGFKKGIIECVKPNLYP